MTRKSASISGILREGLKPVRELIYKDPAVASMLLGGGLGAYAAGPEWRTRGAFVGGLGGLGGGMLGAGVLKGTARSGTPRNFIAKTIGTDPLVHQLGGAGGLGFTAGTLIQPQPTPVWFSGGTPSGATPEGFGREAGPVQGLQNKIHQAVDLLKGSEK